MPYRLDNVLSWGRLRHPNLSSVKRGRSFRRSVPISAQLRNIELTCINLGRTFVTDRQCGVDHVVNLQVETCPGEAGTEMIRRFRVGDQIYDVIENLDQWHGEGYRYFKIKTADGSLYILRFDEVRRDWDLTMFKKPLRWVWKSLH